jgi:hypothetical protein
MRETTETFSVVVAAALFHHRTEIARDQNTYQLPKETINHLVREKKSLLLLAPKENLFFRVTDTEQGGGKER